MANTSTPAMVQNSGEERRYFVKLFWQSGTLSGAASCRPAVPEPDGGGPEREEPTEMIVMRKTQPDSTSSIHNPWHLLGVDAGEKVRHRLHDYSSSRR
jgi:hypothetical protein